MRLFIFEHIYGAEIAIFWPEKKLLFTHFCAPQTVEKLKAVMTKINVMPQVDLSSFYTQDIQAIWQLSLEPVSTENNPVKPTKKSK